MFLFNASKLFRYVFPILVLASSMQIQGKTCLAMSRKLEFDNYVLNETKFRIQAVHEINRPQCVHQCLRQSVWERVWRGFGERNPPKLLASYMFHESEIHTKRFYGNGKWMELLRQRQRYVHNSLIDSLIDSTLNVLASNKVYAHEHSFVKFADIVVRYCTSKKKEPQEFFLWTVLTVEF